MITLTQAAEHFAAAAERCRPELEALVETITVRAGYMARSYIGHEHDDWPALSSATVEGFTHAYGFYIKGKRELGYGGYESPLLRTGQGRDSTEVLAIGLVGEVGSNDKIMLYQEEGTPMARYPIPPRPVYAKAIMEAVGGVRELGDELLLKLLVPA